MPVILILEDISYLVILRHCFTMTLFLLSGRKRLRSGQKGRQAAQIRPFRAFFPDFLSRDCLIALQSGCSIVGLNSP